MYTQTHTLSSFISSCMCTVQTASPHHPNICMLSDNSSAPPPCYCISMHGKHLRRRKGCVRGYSDRRKKKSMNSTYQSLNLCHHETTPHSEFGCMSITPLRPKGQAYYEYSTSALSMNEGQGAQDAPD
ncbi:hypothetical protein BO99DRAFT_82772 [Aspergillus violaceofuscus CBS 115571]|uniref:Uncharacterized protein n=1 Tax=Aspergillus violaceofuscus (strain CBS 115571) TaxID=1450538 RepID=A0A2V5HIT9_ASPV1|nr:hypothetical protein BO99DRAFT_82772 [Aspergillus violaceofuscus CBS 115571]